MLATRPRPAAVVPATARTRWQPGLRLSTSAIAAGGTSLTYIAARDGTVGWQLTRGLVAASLSLLAAGALRGAHSAIRSATELVAGTLALCFGIGIGPAHLTKAGPLLMTFAGLTSVLAGIALLIVGAARAVGLTRGLWRVPLLTSILAVTAAAALTLGQSVAATNAPRTAVGPTTPADRGLRYRDVAFPAVDGVQLSGWYIPSKNGAGVVLLHGAGSTRSGVLDHAAVLARRGYGVLLFDARGHGRSAGRAMDFGWYGDADIAGAVSFLQARVDIDDGRIAAVGMSMGGEEAIGAAATDTRIQAVVAEGATNRVAGDKAWLSEEFGWRGAAQEGLERFLYGITDLLTEATPPRTLRSAVAATAPRPVLLIASGAEPDEGSAGRYIRAGSPATVELWIVPDAGHTAGLRAQRDEWEQRVTAFLAQALRLSDSIAAPASLPMLPG